jgi:hypothetical protein
MATEQAIKLMVSLRDNPQAAYLCYQKIKDLPFSEKEREQLDYELGIICYYLDKEEPFEERDIHTPLTPKEEEGFRALNRILLTGVDLVNESLANIYWYLRPIEVERWTSIKLRVPGGYSCLNPSIIKYGSGYLANIRASNYTIIKGDYFPNAANGIINNLNYLCYYTRDLRLTKVTPLPQIHIEYPVNAYGLEDIRLYYHKGDVIFTCNSRNNHPYVAPRVSVGKIFFGEEVTIQVEHQPSPDGNTGCEKNWLFLRKGTYLYDPFTIIKNNRVIKRAPKMGNLRCSAGPVGWRKGILFLVHEVIWRGKERTYIHRFCHWGDKYTISEPFIFHYRGVEYPIGLVWHKGNLLVGLGLRDREAWWAEIDRRLVETMLDRGKCVQL